MKYRLPTLSAAVAGISLVAALFAGACSSNSTTPSTTTTTTTTPPAATCTFTIGSTSANANGGGDTITVSVTASGATCAWTAVSNSSFITIKSGASGTGSGTVVLTIAPNQGGARSGTVTIAGGTLTVNQPAGPTAAFQLFDPGASGSSATTECRFRNPTATPTTCTLRSTSFTLDATAIVSYSWQIQYTYDTVKTITGSNSSIDIVDTCGQPQATDDGVSQPLSVTLTVTDSKGNTATTTSGSGNSPALAVRLFNCGV